MLQQLCPEPQPGWVLSTPEQLVLEGPCPHRVDIALLSEQTCPCSSKSQHTDPRGLFKSRGQTLSFLESQAPGW